MSKGQIEGENLRVVESADTQQFTSYFHNKNAQYFSHRKKQNFDFTQLSRQEFTVD